MLSRSILFGAAMIIIGGGGAQAATLSSGPLPTALASYSCGAVNTGVKDVESVVVTVTITGAAPGSGTRQSCASLAPGQACVAATDANAGPYRYCTITAKGGKRTLRGTFCNLTMGVCIPVQ